MLTQDMINDRGKLSYPKLSEKYGVTIAQLRKQFAALGLPPLKKGHAKKPFEDYIVQVKYGVKRKHYNEAKIKINELLKQYR